MEAATAPEAQARNSSTASVSCRSEQVAAADDEVQTLSGSVRRAPSGPPGAPGTPSCAAAAKDPGAQQPKPASLGRGRGAAAAILSLGNVLNYLDRYTVAGVLLDIQQHFGVKDRGAGLLQSGPPCWARARQPAPGQVPPASWALST
ncbi:protein spinster homolog 2-like, partial [Leptonychotes weddellii]|uniref:Protein spinster homolog 2-like n=1 Tax=Leptonychotes weddellii TaxID=9713 RepID=A0A7F8Q3T5_LEPWE